MEVVVLVSSWFHVCCCMPFINTGGMEGRGRGQDIMNIEFTFMYSYLILCLVYINHNQLYISEYFIHCHDRMRDWNRERAWFSHSNPSICLALPSQSSLKVLTVSTKSVCVCVSRFSAIRCEEETQRQAVFPQRSRNFSPRDPAQRYILPGPVSEIHGFPERCTDFSAARFSVADSWKSD